MPLFDYVCTKSECTETLIDKLVRRASTQVTCSCGSPMERSRVNRTAFQLKGGGWYKDHYGLKSTKPDGNISGD